MLKADSGFYIPRCRLRERLAECGDEHYYFSCCAARLAIELDGGQHDENQEYDRQRTLWLNQKGWYVIRFWNNELCNNEEAVLEKILETLKTLLPSPRPSP
ncbi:DUF559 domain-containing protein [Enterobacter sichuanensis]|nr:DUF559 domain-containing protein [Enterobacter sichuanensis]